MFRAVRRCRAGDITPLMGFFRLGVQTFRGLLSKRHMQPSALAPPKLPKCSGTAHIGGSLQPESLAEQTHGSERSLFSDHARPSDPEVMRHTYGPHSWFFHM
jgi:hypothetical protein